MPHHRTTAHHPPDTAPGHPPLTTAHALALATVLDAAVAHRTVSYTDTDGLTTTGTALQVTPSPGSTAPLTCDVRDAFLRVATATGTLFWPVADLAAALADNRFRTDPHPRPGPAAFHHTLRCTHPDGHPDPAPGPGPHPLGSRAVGLYPGPGAHGTVWAPRCADHARGRFGPGDTPRLVVDLAAGAPAFRAPTQAERRP